MHMCTYYIHRGLPCKATTVICIKNCRCGTRKFVCTCQTLPKIYIYIYIVTRYTYYPTKWPLIWTSSLREHIVSWQFDKKPAREIAALANCSEATVYNVLCLYRMFGRSHRSISLAMEQTASFGSRRYELYIFSAMWDLRFCRTNIYIPSPQPFSAFQILQKKVLSSLLLGEKISIMFQRKAPTPRKRLGSAKLHVFWILKVTIIGSTENAIDLNFATWCQCGELIWGLDNWSETQNVKESAITREERQLRDPARRKTLMSRLDVTLSQIFVVLFSAMFGRYKQAFTCHIYSFLCKSL